MRLNQYYLRPVQIDDAKILYAWATSDDVRYNAINQNKFSYEDHVKWLTQKLNDTNCKFFIMIRNKDSVGQIRVDKIDNQWILDYSIDSAWRGKNLGKKAIELILQQEKQLDLSAKVLETNTASINTFEKLGFKRIESEVINGRVFLNFILKKGK